MTAHALNRFAHKSILHMSVDYSYEENGKRHYVFNAEAQQPVVIDRARIEFEVDLPAVPGATG